MNFRYCIVNGDWWHRPILLAVVETEKGGPQAPGLPRFTEGDQDQPRQLSKTVKQQVKRELGMDSLVLT